MFAALHNGNADGKRCSNACVTELRFIASEVAVLNGAHLWSSSTLVYFLGKGAEKARSKRDQSEIKQYPKWTRYRTRFRTRCERGSTLQHLPTKAGHCACHDNFHNTGLAQTLSQQCLLLLTHSTPSSLVHFFTNDTYHNYPCNMFAKTRVPLGTMIEK